VNSNHHPNRQRFTIAHELGHIMLHRAKLDSTVLIDKNRNFIPRDPVSAEGTDRFEMQANAFASELLMPERLLKQVLSESAGDFHDDEYLKSLAKKFKVSLAALQYRLARL
jgi:Zn-dependent peptidase ImmA (M78 family)